MHILEMTQGRRSTTLYGAISGGLEAHDTYWCYEHVAPCTVFVSLCCIPLIYTMQLPAPVPVIVTPHKVFALWPHPHAKYFV
jgi:hypothetical protein